MSATTAGMPIANQRGRASTTVRYRATGSSAAAPATGTNTGRTR